MTAELARTEPVDLPTVFDSDLVRWARDAAEAYKVATSLVKTSFVPDSMRGKPEEAAAAILTGSEIGLSPMAALRSIDIIQGTPAMRAHALRGLVQSRGHRVWLEEASATKAVVRGQRLGEDAVQESVWTLDRAKTMKLTDKHNWKVQPQAMLVARATSELCRLVASDVLLGLPYSAEELDDLEPESKPTGKRTVKRATMPEIEAPSLETPAEDTPEPVEAETVPEAPAAPEPPLTDGDWPPVAEVPSE